MQRDFAGVLFDCDGVLVDSESITNGVLREMLHELGWPLSAAECVRLFIGRALIDCAELIYAHTGRRITPDWIAAFHARRDAALRRSLTAMPGAAAAVAEVFAAVDGKIACASGADRAKVEMQLQLTGLDRWFAGRIFSGMEQPRSKPAPDVYLAAAAALGISSTAALVIEDSIAGVTAGRAAGATVWGFAPDVATRTDPTSLLAAGAERVCTSLAELPPLLRQTQLA